MLGLWTLVNDNWEDSKKPGNDFFVELLDLRLCITNVTTNRIGQLKVPLVVISLCLLWFNIKEDFNSVPGCCTVQSIS